MRGRFCLEYCWLVNSDSYYKCQQWVHLFAGPAETICHFIKLLLAQKCTFWLILYSALASTLKITALLFKGALLLGSVVPSHAYCCYLHGYYVATRFCALPTWVTNCTMLKHTTHCRALACRVVLTQSNRQPYLGGINSTYCEGTLIVRESSYLL